MDYSHMLAEVGRIIFGLYFLRSGIRHFTQIKSMAQYAAFKKVPQPKLAVGGSGALLILGALGVLFNMYIPLAVLCLVLFLVPVTFSMHAFWKEKDANTRMAENVNFYKNLALLGAALMLLALPV